MTRIGLLSDTHGYLDPQLIPYLIDCDEIWHAGDFGAMSVYNELVKLEKPIRGVFGNIDGKEIREFFDETVTWTTENKIILMTHIGGSPDKYSPVVRQKLQDIKPGIFICGHSHILKVIYDKKYNLLHLNPGAAGKEGFHKVRTMLRFVINNEMISNMEIIEFDK